MKKKQLVIQFPESYLEHLLKLSIKMDKSPNELLARAFEVLYMKEQDKKDTNEQ